MAQNTSAGDRAYDRGLVLQTKPEIDTSEAGLKQGTFRFLLNNTLWPNFEPRRAVPCNNFGAEVGSRTLSFLTGVSFMGAQTKRWTHNGHCPGVGILEVLCQGAVFGQALSTAPVLSVAIADRGLLYTIAPNVAFNGGTPSVPAVAIARLVNYSVVIAAGGSGYTTGDVLTVTGGTFDLVLKLKVLVTAGVVSGVTVYQFGRYSSSPSNPVAVTGGTGTGATFTINWNVGYLAVVSGGAYFGLPTASFTGGNHLGNSQAVAGAVTMGAYQQIAGSDFTTPFNPITTVKDTVQFDVFTGTAGAGTTTFAVRVATTALPAYTHGTYGGYDGIRANAHGVLPPQDGVTLNIGDKVLLADDTAFSGVYKVAQVGAPDPNFTTQGAPWILIRVVGMDESSEVTNTVFVNAAEGTANAGQWQCTVSGSFTINTDPITFAKIGTGSTAQNIPLFKVTVDYHAIELHFNYVAKAKSPTARFLRNEYQRNDAGDIIIDPATGEAFTMEIDSVIANQLITTTDPTTGQVSVTDGAQVAISEDTWRNAVKYLGTGAQFTQTPAGQYWAVEETTTIKIVPIPPTGTVVGG